VAHVGGGSAFTAAAAVPGQLAVVVPALHLAGHAQTCTALRAILRGRLPRRIRARAYWASGKTGL
jgi:hypothetical protein